MRRLVVFCFASALAACGGTDSGVKAFDVTAMLTLNPDEPFLDFPSSHTFTLASNGRESLVTGALGMVFVLAPPTTGASFELPFSRGCHGVADVGYDEIQVSIDGAALMGMASGVAVYDWAGMQFLTPVTATLAGTLDTTPPSLIVPAGEIDPLAPIQLSFSEPVTGGDASLVGETSGDVLPLGRGVALSKTGWPELLRDFTVSGRALRPAETYNLLASGIADLTGNALATLPALKTRPAPALGAEDGFESLTTATFGGAGVLRGGPLPPIAGTTSLILNTGVGGGFGFLPYTLGPTLLVRLSVQPGDTMIRFTQQLVATASATSARFDGDIRYGFVGGEIRHDDVALQAMGDLAKVTLPMDGDVYVSAPAPIELPIPAGSAGELLFEIVGETRSCGGVPPPSTALIIDDLRVE